MHADAMLPLGLALVSWPLACFLAWLGSRKQYAQSKIPLPFNWRVLIWHTLYLNWVKRRWRR